jgi:hypothetical protein
MRKRGMHVQELLFCIGFASLGIVNNRVLEGINILVNRLGANNPAGIVFQRGFITEYSDMGIYVLPTGICSRMGEEIRCRDNFLSKECSSYLKS